MDEAQKKYILSILANEVMKEPTKYGLQADGIVRVGETIDLGPLFKDVEKLKDIFEKANKLTPEQKASILENNRKIAAWVKEHPTDMLSTDKVNEILASTPKKVELPTPPKQEYYEHVKPAIKNIVETAEPIKAGRSMASDSVFAEAVENAFNSEINGIYSEGGILGLGKTIGVKSKEWLFISRLPVSKVLDFYTNDSDKSDLADEIKTRLQKSEKHHELVKQILGLIQQTNGVVKPYENENIEEFLRRLGGFVMKNASK